mmetsp:Transcript_3026/g.7530  ORF Transcript_3026/g.7530 Transcript_3026/m.7530 type:complete len:284 (-) Transcript_3026:398-1249(-)
MSSTYERIFGSDIPAAGLTSSQQQVSAARHSPVKCYATYEPSREHALRPHEPTSPTLRRQIEASTQASALREIAGAQPSRRPIYATAFTPSHMRTSRCTNPLEPVYPLPTDCPSPTRTRPDTLPLPQSQSQRLDASTHPLSRSLDVSDIPGARPRPSTVSSSRLYSSIDYSDVAGTRPHVRGQGRPTHTPATLTTEGIHGASPAPKARREVVSPGRGTLHASDIQGARPGTSRVSDVLPSIWSLGRYPMPATPSYAFNMKARHMMLQRPQEFAITEERRGARA